MTKKVLEIKHPIFCCVHIWNIQNYRHWFVRRSRRVIVSMRIKKIDEKIVCDVCSSYARVSVTSTVGSSYLPLADVCTWTCRFYGQMSLINKRWSGSTFENLFLKRQGLWIVGLLKVRIRPIFRNYVLLYFIEKHM